MLKAVLRLKGRIAIVTGSTSGIGLAIADRLAQEGAKVIISSRQQKNVDDTVKQLLDKGYDVSGVACHITNKDQRNNLVKEAEKLGGLDIFVQSAGVNPYIGSILDCPETAWDKIFETNLKANFLLTKELLHLLKKSKFGRVIYNSSISAYMSYEPLGAYSVSKTALISFTKQAAMHLGKYNVTVNCVAPGLVDTPFGRVLMKDKAIIQTIETFNAIKRPCKVEEVSGLVAFLASDDSTYITGETICVGGGYSCRV